MSKARWKWEFEQLHDRRSKVTQLNHETRGEYTLSNAVCIGKLDIKAQSIWFQISSIFDLLHLLYQSSNAMSKLFSGTAELYRSLRRDP